MRALLLLAALLASAPVRGGDGWIALGGPPGGDVRSLASDPRDPRTLFLGTTDGHLYRSDDGGSRWRRTAPGFPLRGMSLDEIVVTPAGDVLVGYWEIAGGKGGVARSIDGGATFRMGRGIEGESVRAVAVAPSRPGIVVAGTLSGVFRSEDGGDTWRRISPPGHPELRNFESIAIDPENPDIVFAGTWHLAWKTVDGGQRWQPIHRGMIPDSDVFTLTLDRRTPRTLYATACSGIYRSLDAGITWTRLHGIPASSRRTRAFAQDPERPERLYAGTTEGLYVSETDGESWRRVSDWRLVVNAVLVLRGGVVLLGSDGLGVLRSTNRGRTFVASNAGFAERFVSRIVFDAEGARVLAGIAGDRHFGGVLEARGVEGPWTAVGTGLEGREVLSLALADGEVLAGTDQGIFLSSSSLRSWKRLPAAAGEAYPRAVDVAVPATRVFLVATPEGLLRSADGGQTWRVYTLGSARSVQAVATLPGRQRRCLAATALGVYASDDLGVTWTAEPTGVGNPSVRSLVALPGADGIVIATTGHGILRSADRGVTWSPRGGGLPQSDISGIAVHPDGRTVFATDFVLGGVYRSEDAGDTWSRLSTEGLPSDHVFAIAVDPTVPSRIISATPSGGLHILSVPPAPRQASP